jgi:hypothetical protein
MACIVQEGLVVIVIEQPRSVMTSSMSSSDAAGCTLSTSAVCRGTRDPRVRPMLV